MVREIEYRAWHKEDKKMLHVCGIDWMINLEQDCVEIGVVNCAERRSDGGWVNGGSHDIEDVILMQYTGTKDKNSVKCFYDDVVKINQGGEYYQFVVAEVDGNTAILDMNNHGIVYDFLVVYEKEFEVIGNIHEEKK